VRGFHTSAKFEVLFPYDVNHPVPAGVHLVGGRLNRFVNLPIEWEIKESSGLDRLKIEALDFGAWSRDLDLVRAVVLFALGLGWPRGSLRYMLAVFQPGYAWQKECLTALGEGIAVANLWAFDHICLFGPDPNPARHSAIARRQR
jgi:hypothetical protein